jgi:chromosome segregation ATPase
VTPEHAALCERLRDCEAVTFSAGLHSVERDCKDAAAAIESLSAELATLRMECLRHAQTIAEQNAELASARKVIETVRERLWQLCPADFKTAAKNAHAEAAYYAADRYLYGLVKVQAAIAREQGSEHAAK